MIENKIDVNALTRLVRSCAGCLVMLSLLVAVIAFALAILFYIV